MTIILILIDQASKAAVQSFMHTGQSILLIPRVLSLTYTLNSGAAFGLLDGSAGILAFITIIIIAFIIFYFRERVQWDNIQMSLGISFWVSGALGNLIDRIRVGMVVDFIHIHFWPVFNIADSSILIGSLLLFWSLYKYSERDVDDETGIV